MNLESETPKTPKEEVLAALTELWKNWDTGTLEDNIAWNSALDAAQKRAKELGVTFHEIKRAEFLAEPEDQRQEWLDRTAFRNNIGSQIRSLEHGRELFSALEQIRVEFGLKDPFNK